MYPIFVLAWVALVTGLLVSTTVRRQARLYVGECLHQNRSASGTQARLAGLVALGAALAWALAAGELSPGLSLPTLALTALLMWQQPAAGDGVIGTLGLRRGWQVLGYNELEEWRLAGEHFRFRVGPRWFALPMPEAKHAGLAQELRLRAPERESEFR